MVSEKEIDMRSESVEPLVFEEFEFEGRVLIPDSPIVFYPRVEHYDDLGRTYYIVCERLFNKFSVVASSDTLEGLRNEIADFIFFYWDSYTTENLEYAPAGAIIMAGLFTPHFQEVVDTCNMPLDLAENCQMEAGSTFAFAERATSPASTI